MNTEKVEPAAVTFLGMSQMNHVLFMDMEFGLLDVVNVVNVVNLSAYLPMVGKSADNRSTKVRIFLRGPTRNN